MEIIIAITSYFEIIPLIVGLFLLKHVKDIVAKLFMGFLISIMFIDLASYIRLTYYQTNLIVYNIFDIITTIFMLLCFYYGGQKKHFAKGIISVFIILCMVCYFLLTDMYTVNKLNNFITNFTQIIVSGYMLIKLLDKKNIVLQNEFRFWLFAGLLIFSFSTLTIYLMDDIYRKNDAFVFIYTRIYYWVMVLVTNTFYTLALLCQKKDSTSISL
ncbi:MAG: hypothetical protein WCO54_05330 [Bacteroidota bacterium]